LQAGSVGTITSGGLFSSPGVLGSATVVGSIGSATNSATITVDDEAPSLLVIGGQPSAGFVDGNINVVVDVENALGQIVTTDNSDVTLTVISGPVIGGIAGTVTVPAVHGVAMFSNVAVTGSGSYSFEATDGTLTSSMLGTIAVVPAPTIHFALSGIPLSPEARAFQERQHVSSAGLATLMTLAATTPSAIAYTPIPVSKFQQWVNLQIEEASLVLSSSSVGASTFSSATPISDLLTFDGSSGGGDATPATDKLATENDLLK
jgi:hypothetical protein